MSDPAILESIISVALGAGSGGATAYAVLHTRLSAAEKKLEDLDSSLGSKHEANVARIANLEAGHAATNATMAGMTSSLVRVEASIDRMNERMAAFPNELATLLDSRLRRQ